MDLDEARDILGIEPEDEWRTVRRVYRQRIRAAHPDVTGPAGTRHAARLNEAYAVVARAQRSVPAPRVGASGATRARPGEPAPTSPPAQPTTPAAPGVSLGAPAEGAETLLFEAPPDQAFMRLLDAGHTLGEVSYVDRNCGIFEVIVPHGGETCSLLLTVEPRGHGAVAYCSLESLERVASPSAHSTAHQLVSALRTS